MTYVLAHSPDEFGLVPDEAGFVTYKELLQAMHEESGWRYVRRTHVHEVLLGEDRALFDWDEKRIRAAERRWEWGREVSSQDLPKTLFTPVRRKAHPVAMEKGLRAPKAKHLALSPDREMARRMGSRRDQRPVILEVRASIAAQEGLPISAFGELFLAKEIPARFISGPPVSPDEQERPRAKEPEAKALRREPLELTPGSFLLDGQRDPDLRRRTKGRKRKGWKEEARKKRRGRRR
jgi:putative RNA 2'-phosphotransferase